MANLTSPAKARHCHGENPKVWEITGDTHSDLLRKAAEVIEESECGFAHAANFHSDDEGNVYLILVAS